MSSTGRRDAGSWMEARGADLMDVAGARLAAGAGLGVHVRATKLVQLGILYRGPTEADDIGTTRQRMRAVPCIMFGTIGRYGGVWFDRHEEIMFPGYSSRVRPQAIEREVFVGAVSLDGSDDRWEASIGAGVHALLAGVEFELRPFEAVDFVAGLLLGYDPSSDDVPVAEE